MKKLMYTMLMLVVACTLTFAQSDTSADKKSDKMGGKTGKEKTVSGCVMDHGGKYMLMDKKHPEGVELNTSEDLKPHVGHKMSFTGSMDGSAMKVSSMKMISDKCEAGMAKEGGMDKK